MKTLIIRFLLFTVILLINAYGAAAEKNGKESLPNSDWLLLIGGGKDRTYWTVQKLRPIDSVDVRKHESTLELGIMIAGVVGDALITSSEIASDVDENLELVVEPDMAPGTLLEMLITKTFPGITFETRLSPSVKYLFQGKSPVFIYDDVIIHLVKGQDKPEKYARLLPHMARSKSEFLGVKTLPAKIDWANGEALAKYFQSLFSETYPDIRVRYSRILGVLIINVPASQDVKFYGYCEAALSGNR